tara:strand:+ start:536 stop:1111 length:576 start_codon:yes stop_codon:yes gene_type:complete
MIYFITLYILYLLSDRIIIKNSKDSEKTKTVKTIVKLCFIMLCILNLYGFCASNIIYSCVSIYIISYIRNDDIKIFLDIFRKETFVQDITKDGSFSRIPNRFRKKDPNIEKYRLENNRVPQLSKTTILPVDAEYSREELQEIKNSLEQKEWVLRDGETYDMYKTKTTEKELKHVYKSICYYIDKLFSMFGL